MGNWDLDRAFVTIRSIEEGGSGWGKEETGRREPGHLCPYPSSPPTLSTFLLPQQRHVTSSMDQLTRILDYLHQEVSLP